MLGKLLKHETKSYAKSVLPFLTAIIVMGLLVRGFSLLGQKVAIFNYASMFTIFAFVITIVLSIVYCFFLTIKHFYQKVLRDEGYLTNTLPVKKRSIISAHLITAIIFMVLTVVIIVIGCIIAFYEPESAGQVWEIAKGYLETEFQIGIGAVITILITVMLFSYISAVLAIYAAMAIGHSFAQNKIPYSIGIGVAFYISYEILNLIGLGIIVLINPDFMNIIQSNEVPTNMVFQIFSLVYISSAIMIVTSYTLTNHFLKNKLNLE